MHKMKIETHDLNNDMISVTISNDTYDIFERVTTTDKSKKNIQRIKDTLKTKVAAKIQLLDKLVFSADRHNLDPRVDDGTIILRINNYYAKIEQLDRPDTQAVVLRASIYGAGMLDCFATREYALYEKNVSSTVKQVRDYIIMTADNVENSD